MLVYLNIKWPYSWLLLLICTIASFWIWAFSSIPWIRSRNLEALSSDPWAHRQKNHDEPGRTTHRNDLEISRKEKAAYRITYWSTEHTAPTGVLSTYHPLEYWVNYWDKAWFTQVQWNLSPSQHLSPMISSPTFPKKSNSFVTCGHEC